MEQKYTGQILSKRYPTGRRGGEWQVTQTELVFDTGEERFHLNPSSIVIESGGAANRLLFISTPLHPDTIFTCSDRRILKESCIASNPVHARSLAAIDGKRKEDTLLKPLYALVAVAIIAAGGWFAWGAATTYLAKSIPMAWEKVAGDKLFSLITMDKRTISDPEIKKDLAVITDPIVKAAGPNAPTFSFVVVDEGEMNAYALPGGHVVINSGLLLKARNANEVAGVIAHEIAHVTERHHLRGFFNQAGIVIVLQTIFGDVTALAAAVANYSSSLATLKNSREFEFEADKKGFDYLRKARIDPQGMVSFFDLILSDRTDMEKKIDKNLSILSTHPATGERIEHLKKLIRKHPGSTTSLNLDYAAFKNRLITAVSTTTPSSEGK